MFPGPSSAAAVLAAMIALSSSETRAQATRAPVGELQTPASVALLAGRLDAVSVTNLRAALTHQDATVRAIAALIAGIQKMDLATDLARVLEGEKDERAAAEQIRALLFVDDATWRETVERRLSATRPLEIRAYVEWLVRNRPDMLADRMAEVFQAVPATELHQFSSLVSAAIQHHPAMADRLLRGWMRIASGSAWRSVLNATGERAREAEAAVLRDALDSQNAEVREETVWALVSRMAYGQDVAPIVIEGALPRQSGAEPVTWETVGRELVARVHRGVSTPDRAEFYKTESARRRGDAAAAAYFPQLTVGEREALRSVLKDDMPEPRRTKRPDPPKEAKPPSMPMRTVSVAWPALLQDLMRESGCQASQTSYMVGFTVAFRGDGRPERAGLAGLDLAPQCDKVLATLARLTLADVGDTILPGVMQTFVLPLNKDFVACVGELKQVSGARPVRADSLERPRKVRDVRPVYPPLAQQNRIQGLVIIEGTISATGCARSLVVLRSVHPLLDMAAIQAVSGWRFTPTLLNGQPVPVIMTVTVNFTLE